MAYFKPTQRCVSSVIVVLNVLYLASPASVKTDVPDEVCDDTSLIQSRVSIEAVQERIGTKAKCGPDAPNEVCDDTSLLQSRAAIEAARTRINTKEVEAPSLSSDGAEVEASPLETQPHYLPSFFVAIVSRREARERRKVLRNARAGLAASGLNVTMKFMVCRGHGGIADEAFAQEARDFRDLHELPCEGHSYRSLTRKVNLSMQAYLDDYGDRDLFMKMDDDTFVAWHRLKRKLVKAHIVNGNWTSLYMGYNTTRNSVARKPGFAWYASREEWPYDMFPRTMQGGAYILSHDMVKRVLEEGRLNKRANVLWHIEDRRTAHLVSLVESAGTPVKYVHIPGTAGYSQKDIQERSGEYPQEGNFYIIKTGNWSEYPYLMHHHLTVESIKCLDLLDEKLDGSALVDSCFAGKMAS